LLVILGITYKLSLFIGVSSLFTLSKLFKISSEFSVIALFAFLKVLELFCNSLISNCFAILCYFKLIFNYNLIQNRHISVEF
jgi:hypothetical protein